MSILIWAKKESNALKNLETVIEEVIPDDQVQIFRDTKSFGQRLKTPGRPPKAAVLLASTREDLLELKPLNGLLEYIRFILILPDREKETISQGHSLRPRYLSYVDAGFLDVGAVLKKMLKKGPYT